MSTLPLSSLIVICNFCNYFPILSKPYYQFFLKDLSILVLSLTMIVVDEIPTSEFAPTYNFFFKIILINIKLDIITNLNQLVIKLLKLVFSSISKKNKNRFIFHIHHNVQLQNQNLLFLFHSRL